MSLADDTPLRDLADRVVRNGLRDPDNLREFLQVVVPEIADNFDYARARLLEREFPLDDWRRREADLPFEIPYRYTSPNDVTRELLALVYVLIEHQSDTDPWMPFRLLLGIAMYWERQWKASEQQSPRAPAVLRPVLPIVLYTGSRPWGSNRTLADMLGEPEGFQPFAPTLRPIFWNLADHTPRQLLQVGTDWFRAMAVIRAEREDPAAFATVYEEAVRGLESLQRQNEVRWYDVLRILLTWAMWRRPRSEHKTLMDIAESSAADTRKREVRMIGEQTGEMLADYIWAKAEEAGRTKGERAALQTILEDRFGSLPEELVRRIEACDDPNALQTAIRQSLRIAKPEELQLP